MQSRVLPKEALDRVQDDIRLDRPEVRNHTRVDLGMEEDDVTRLPNGSRQRRECDKQAVDVPRVVCDEEHDCGALLRQ